MLETHTLGRVLVLFGAMADYILLTSPFGADDAAGDELAQRRASKTGAPARPRATRTLAKDEEGAAQLFIAHKLAHPAMKRQRLADLPEIDRQILADSGLLHGL